ncbi:O-methyltransferase-domain-containing protein [Lipomyces starkeyi]
MSDSTYPLEKLSLTIARNAIIVSQYLAAHNLPQPSSSSDGPSTILPTGSPQSVHQAREHLIATALELLQLATGPSEFLPHLATSFQFVSCLRWLCQFNIFHLVPLSSTITYVDLAAAAKVPEQRLKSIIRMAMTTSLFQELPDGTAVTHSATSALLARNEETHAYAWYMSARTAPCALQMAPAHEKWGAGSLRTNETAFNLAFGTDMPFFEYLSQNEEMMKDFAQYMRNVRSAEGVDIKHLVAGFGLQGIPDGGTVVDIGGSTGTSAIALAKAYPHLIFTVQDLPANAENGRKTAESLPADIASRITFQAHDFKTAQPVQGADVYLLRMILHDWPDDEATSILKNIVAAMDKRKSRLLIMDTVLPRPGSVSVSVERVMRARDMVMMQAFNSKERDLDDWIKLLVTADLKLRLVNVVQPFGSVMSVLELALA